MTRWVARESHCRPRSKPGKSGSCSWTPDSGKAGKACRDRHTQGPRVQNYQVDLYPKNTRKPPKGARQGSNTIRVVIFKDPSGWRIDWRMSRDNEVKHWEVNQQRDKGGPAGAADEDMRKVTWEMEGAKLASLVPDGPARKCGEVSGVQPGLWFV